ncbi:hypothetical protein [Paraburkholderia sp. BR14320]|uniref:hypothetical protein n=1 Tax=unclassified Paraburkholderia TaxID=2615204 RepID=UPI0034CE35C5
MYWQLRNSPPHRVHRIVISDRAKQATLVFNCLQNGKPNQKCEKIKGSGPRAFAIAMQRPTKTTNSSRHIPGEEAHKVRIDHTKLDSQITVRDYDDRAYRMSMVLTVLMDEETRTVLAFDLAAHRPSTVSCMTALRVTVAPHTHLPDIIVCGKGKEFHSNAFDRFFGLENITIGCRPASQSRFRGVIERLFGVAKLNWFTTE